MWKGKYVYMLEQRNGNEIITELCVHYYNNIILPHVSLETIEIIKPTKRLLSGEI